MIAENLRSVTQRISRACERSGRKPQDVGLVCVTKDSSIDDARTALSLGARILGENRVQEALTKHAALGSAAEWHMIGHLQTNKAKDAVRIFSLIHSVDSIRLAQAIDKEAARMGKVQDALAQVNVAGEKTKFGMAPADLEDFLKEAGSYQNISINGLMTIAPEADDPQKVRPYFRALRELRDRFGGLKVLSMGMTNDFEIAIEEGSTMVRVGRAIFSG